MHTTRYAQHTSDNEHQRLLQPRMATPDHIPGSASFASSAMDAFLAPFLKAGGRRSNKSNTNSRPGTGDDKRRVLVSIFDVPPGLLTHAGEEESHETSHGDISLSSFDQAVAAPRVIKPAVSAGTANVAVSAADRVRGLTCVRCGLSFDARPVQLAHFKSDLHMTNLRRQLAGKPPLSQEQLDAEAAAKANAIGNGIDGGGGGVASEEEDSSGTESDAAEGAAAAGDDGIDLEDVAEEGEVGGLLVAETAQRAGDGVRSSKRGRVKVDFSFQGGPKLTFVPRGSAWSFSLSSAALGMGKGDDPWARLDGLVGDDGGDANRLWAVLILRSGKFAAAVFEGQSVLCHKVFRRYTIRAKRGGSQSSYDSGGRKAQSAGAALRRYGEQALREDTRALLKEWEGPLKACSVVLTSVPKGMRNVLFDGKDAPFDRKDPRLRPIPFAVGKPVFEEVVAVHTRVTSVVFSDAAAVSGDDHIANKESAPADKGVPGVVAEGGATKQSAKGAAAAAAGGVKGPASAEKHAVEAEPCPPSKEFIEACEGGDVDAAAALLDRLGLNTDPTVGVAGNGGAAVGVGWTAGEVIDYPDGLERLMTPLHVAAASGHVAVLGMLMERGANPLAEDVRGRVPYLLAANKDTRDVFRRARAAQPGRWDWDAARVPEPLTEELEQRQKEKLKEKEKEKKRRAKLRKKAEKDRAEEEARQRKKKEEAEAEDRRKRGLAAAGHCDACGKGLVEKKAFSRLEFRYCSSDCVQVHKRKLAADAAERRFNGGGGGQKG